MGNKDYSNNEHKNSGITWKSILGGDILAHDFFKRQINLLCLIVVLTIVYIDNRYSSQREMIEIDKLKKELTEKSRQSRIETYISEKGTPIATSAQPPYLIKEDY